MPYSVYNNDFSFNEQEWVVTLINTKTGIEGVFGGHAKIVVEGIRRRGSSLYDTELFIGEYHIMEAEGMAAETWIPQALRNTHSRYVVLWREENQYSRSEEQCQSIQARSHGALVPSEVMKMIDDIKQEQFNIEIGENIGNFQYAGEWCIYSYKGGHNCISWAEEKLNIIGIGKYLITDSSKASPFLHVNSANMSSCGIL
jgi:hypothetical protein